MSNKLLDIINLNVNIEDKNIIKNLNLSILQGETHVIMGPNGAGKSTLGYAIMGHPKYEITSGDIIFDGETITDENTDSRAKKGVFLSFQNPEELPGISFESFIRTAKTSLSNEFVSALANRKELNKNMDQLNIDKSYAARYLNVGFSGGEKKKSEILQMLMLNPKLAILDETDSGLDVDAVKIVSKGIEEFKNSNNSLLIITHNTKILESLHVDKVHIIVNGEIVKSGDHTLINYINANGYKSFTS